ncbi:MAG: gamma-glutamyltransferase family protein [SAR202 cluster bacterium]|nr:gamma-glutamyltransferase family protein [SAR202 cluster bacterium]
MAPNGIPSYRPPATGINHAVSSGNYFATLAGYKMLEEGGNAVDAGVAAGIAINVTQPHRTSIAGVAPILVYMAEKNEVVSISGLGRWPKAATLDYFKTKYGAIPLGMPRCIVPSAADAWLTALERFGSMTFEQVVGPSIELADKGFPLTREASEDLGMKDSFSKWPYDATIFTAKGRPLGPFERLVQKDLARVFKNMVEVERASASKGRAGAIHAVRDFFYKGDVAEKMVAFSEKNDGLLTMKDFADFSVTVEKPCSTSYKDYEVYTSGFWCQGPSIIGILNLMEQFDLPALGLNTADYFHVLLESVKLAFSDRHYFYGDPDFVDVPADGLLSKAYAKERRAMIDMKKAWPEMPPKGNPWAHQGTNGRNGRRQEASRPLAKAGPRDPDTSYACAVDKWGNCFSATPSDGVGPTPMVPGLGMIVSSRGTQTWLEEGHPSALAPGKRPRLTPNPAMAFHKGKLYMPFGTPGGDMQPQGMVQMFLNMVEFGMDPQQAVEEPRAGSWSHPDSFWPHTYKPGQVELESRIGKDVAASLEKRGHKVTWLSDWGYRASGLCGIQVDRKKGVLIAAADPRADSYAVGR